MAAAALVLWFRLPTPQTPPTFRSGPSLHLQAIEPIGDVGELPRHFLWSSVARADSYRVELFDADSHRKLRRTIADTMLALDPTFSIPPRGYWVVVGLDELGLPCTEPVLSWYRVAR